MAGFCGTLAVGGLANNDYQRQEVSSLGTYMGTAAYASFDGAKAGASFCMVPYAAEAGVAAFAPYGMRIAGTYATSEMLVGGAMLSGYTVTFSNMTVKINDYTSTVTGYNMMQHTLGHNNYQRFKSVSQFGSDTIFMMGLSNPNLYRRNNYAGNIRQNAMYNNREGGSGSKFQEVFDLADNYTLSDETFNNHILDRHGSNSVYANKSHFNADFDIRNGIDSTLRGENFIVRPNTAGREGYIFEQTFANPIGINSKGKPLDTLKVVIDEFGNVITAFPKK